MQYERTYNYDETHAKRCAICKSTRPQKSAKSVKRGKQKNNGGSKTTNAFETIVVYMHLEPNFYLNNF